MKVQSSLVYSVGILSLLIFVLYLGFMTEYYVLFYDGTDELYEFYKQLQVFNKDAFNIALQIMILTVILMTFELHKYRPGLLGVIYVLGMSIYISLSSLHLLDVLIKNRRDYLEFDFTTMKNYTPSVLAFDFGLIFHYSQLGLLIAFSIIVVITFVQRLRDGNPLIRNFI